MSNVKQAILNGEMVLGIEFGSTRIKAELIDASNMPKASGSYEWENEYVDGIWSYSLDAITTGLQTCYADLLKNVKEKYDVTITKLAAIGFSGMMHGYMAFDKNDTLLVPFRTWRNTITGEASKALTEAFQFNMPQRFSISHLYQAILNNESHVPEISFFTTLAGYIHWKLTGEKVLGVGEASGMFPIDSTINDYDKSKLEIFSNLIADKEYPWTIEEILPKVLVAGEQAGTLTPEGAAFLDISGDLQPGCPLCPPEGDAGTGMTATNSIAPRTGNVSAGTSVFAMIVLEKPLSRLHEELDMVTTPDGSPVAMVHCNNCTSDLNAWVSLFRQFADAFHMDISTNDLYGVLYNKALEGDKDCGGLLAYNYFSGEHITGFEEGRPLFVRTPNANFSLANFMRTHLYTALGALKTGLNILLKEEKVQVDRVLGHGGLFKTKGVGQGILAAAMNTPVSVMETAGEGGSWGIALLASYMIHKTEGESLQQYLERAVFADVAAEEMQPVAADVEGFDAFMERYEAGLAIERAAVNSIQ
ncbi:MAG: xylulokinase [Lachnospiraceae bacterium]